MSTADITLPRETGQIRITDESLDDNEGSNEAAKMFIDVNEEGREQPLYDSNTSADSVQFTTEEKTKVPEGD